MVKVEASSEQEKEKQIMEEEKKTGISLEEKIKLQGSTYHNVLSTEREHKDTKALCSIRCEYEEELENREGLHLVAVVDKSGSMSGRKMESVKLTLEFIISKLTGRDQLGIVEYDSAVRTSLPLTPMHQHGKATAERVVSHLFAGTSTNLSEGLSQGLRLLLPHPSDITTTTINININNNNNNNNSVNNNDNNNNDNNNNNREGEEREEGGEGRKEKRKEEIASVLLMTDGLANEGITNRQGIVEKMKMVGKEVGREYSVNTFGYGEEHDANLLQEIAASTGGTYYYITSSDSIASAFADCLGGLVSVVAQSMELTLTASPLHSIGRIYTPHPITELLPSQSYRISLGTLQAGEERDLLFDLSLPSLPSSPLPSPNASLIPVVEYTLTYYDVGAERMKEVKEIGRIMRCREEEMITANSPNSLVDRHLNRVKAAEALEKAKGLAEGGSFPAASSLLLSTIQSIQSSPSSSHPLCVSLVEELNQMIEYMKNRFLYSTQGQCRINRLSQSVSMQRSSASVLFDTKAKARLRFDSADFESKRLSSSSNPPNPFTNPLISSLNASIPSSSPSLPIKKMARASPSLRRSLRGPLGDFNNNININNNNNNINNINNNNNNNIYNNINL